MAQTQDNKEAANVKWSDFESATLESPRLSIQPITAAHATLMFEGLLDRDSYAFIPEEPPASVEALAARYEHLESRRSPDGTEAWLNWAMIGEDEQARGYVQATVRLAERDAAIAYFVFTRWRRQGLAAEALDALLPALRNAYSITRIDAQIDTRNVASIKLVESLGFTRVRFVAQADEFKGSVSDEYHYSQETIQAADVPGIR